MRQSSQDARLGVLETGFCERRSNQWPSVPKERLDSVFLDRRGGIETSPEKPASLNRSQMLGDMTHDGR